MNELHLFAGAGGGILGGQLLGHRCVCAVENDPYAQAVLVARQNDGTFPAFPVWDDVRTFDGRGWRGIVDVVAGGFPCQDISVAGGGVGIEGERSGLWTEMARIVGDIRPQYVFVENSPALVTRGLGVVLGDLAALGYDCRWQVLSAADLGAPHLRERIWILAHAVGGGQLQPQGRKREQRGRSGNSGVGTRAFPDTDGFFAQGVEQEPQPCDQRRPAGLQNRTRCEPEWPVWPAESGLVRVVDGMANRANRIKAIGNGQVPRVAAAAFAMLAAEFEW